MFNCIFRVESMYANIYVNLHMFVSLILRLIEVSINFITEDLFVQKKNENLLYMLLTKKLEYPDYEL
jgi:hypothetical protein